MTAGERWQVGADGVERPAGLALLISLHIIIHCISLVQVAYFGNTGYFSAATFHIFYDPSRLLDAVVVVAAFSSVALLFTVARFSFGYFIGFYLYAILLGYLMINCFSDLRYDRRLAGFSAAASTVAF